MDISNLMLEKLQVSEVNLKQTNKYKQTTSSFDNQYNNYKNQYDSNVKDVKSKDTKSNDTRIKKSDTKENKFKTTNTNKVKEEISTKDSARKQDEITEKAKNELAKKLDISVEQISLILEQLNITVFDLTDNNHLNNFIQKLLAIDNPVELLLSDKASEIYKDVTHIISEYKNDLECLRVLNTDSISLNEAPVTNEKQAVVSESLNLNTNKENNNEDSIKVQTDESVKESSLKLVDIKNSSENGNSNTNQNNDENETLNQGNSVVAQNKSNVENYNVLGFKNQLPNNDTVSTITNAVAVKDINNIMNQIVEQIKVDIKPDVSEIKLILRPDTLGEVSLRIITENNSVVAQFVAASQQVKEVLESNFNHLKDTLQQLGLIVDELSVSVGDQNSQAKQHFEQNRQKSNRRIEQIIENINGLEGSQDEEYVDPYEINNNQVDYMA